MENGIQFINSACMCYENAIQCLMGQLLYESHDCSMYGKSYNLLELFVNQK